MVNRTLDVQTFLHGQSLDLLAVTETFLSDAIFDGELFDSGYSVHRMDRYRHGGGVMLIIKDSVVATRRQKMEMDCELLWVELASSPLNVLVSVFYNPPGLKDNALLQNSLTFLPNSLPVYFVETSICPTSIGATQVHPHPVPVQQQL